MRVVNIAGKVFGQLTVLKLSHMNKHGSSMWLCRCSCGTEKVVDAQSLKSGGTKSCGCYIKSVLRAGREELHRLSRTHGKTGTREHHIWLNMIYRCENENCPQYKYYGARGVKVCDEWRHDFSRFLTDMGPAPSRKHSIDRYPDQNGNYEPGNCRWATAKEQANNRRDNLPLTYNGETMRLCEWSERLGLHKATISGRLSRGWSVEKTFDTKPGSVSHRRPEKACGQCGKMFHGHEAKQKFCSHHCYAESMKEPRIERQCKECGTMFYKVDKRAVYCSNSCWLKSIAGKPAPWVRQLHEREV